MNRKTKTSGSLVYCGPNIKGLAQTWTIYTNGLPEKLQAAADADKALAGLIVVLYIILTQISQLFVTIKTLFDL